MSAQKVVIVGTLHVVDEPSNPPGIWGGNDPFPGYGLPGRPPGIWGGAPIPVPTPPIFYPPGIWGGGNEPFPGYGLPGRPPGIWPGGTPTHPIVIPPGIWGGGNEPMPTPPISGIPGLPGYEPPKPGEKPDGGNPLPPAVGVPIDGKLVFVPGYGWVFIPSGPRPVPPSHPDHTLPGDLPHVEHPIEKPTLKK